MSNARTFLVADLHLGHANIIKYCNRPFSSVEEMNDALIRNWNNTIGKEDRVFFLGDFALGSKERVIEWGRMLQGRKVFIYGNHDHQKPKVYYDAGFEHVSRWPIMIQNTYLLSHAPFGTFCNREYDGSLINIHGHVHDKTDGAPTISKNSACVCVERWDYKPVELELIRKKIKEARRDEP